jgi:hypothetical protein
MPHFQARPEGIELIRNASCHTPIFKKLLVKYTHFLRANPVNVIALKFLKKFVNTILTALPSLMAISNISYT